MGGQVEYSTFTTDRESAMKLIKLGLITLLVYALTGCVMFPAAKYEFTRFDPLTGDPVAEMTITSRRDLEELEVTYDGTKKTFEGKVGKATSQPSPLEASAARAMDKLTDKALEGG